MYEIYRESISNTFIFHFNLRKYLVIILSSTVLESFIIADIIKNFQNLAENISISYVKNSSIVDRYLRNYASLILS